MKNFLLFLLGLLYMYVLFPIIFVGISAFLWVPLLFKGSVVIGIVITILTLVVVGIADHKLDND